MALAYKGIGTWKSGAGTPQTNIVPACAVGDILVYIQCTKAATSYTISFGSGTWVDVGSVISGTTRFDCWYHVVDGSVSGSVLVNTAGALFQSGILCFSGADTSSPIDVLPAVTTGAAALTFTPANLTTVTADAIVVVHAASQDDNDLTLSVSQSFTAVVSGAGGSTTTSTDMASAVAYKAIPTPGSVTPPTFSESINGPDAWMAMTFAVKPASTAIIEALVGSEALAAVSASATAMASDRSLTSSGTGQAWDLKGAATVAWALTATGAGTAFTAPDAVLDVVKAGVAEALAGQGEVAVDAKAATAIARALVSTAGDVATGGTGALVEAVTLSSTTAGVANYGVGALVEAVALSTTTPPGVALSAQAVASKAAAIPAAQGVAAADAKGALVVVVALTGSVGVAAAVDAATTTLGRIVDLVGVG